MNKAKVIDTSYHKGYIDWQAVKDGGGVEGVILKASDGFFMPDDMEGTTWTGHSDPSFVLYWKELKNYFAWRGAYHFLRVDDEIAIQRGRLTSQEQIQFFYDLVVEHGLEDDDIIIIDAEQKSSQTDYLDPAVIAKRVKDAVALAEELFGRKVMIYTGAWWWEKYHYHFDQDFFDEVPFWLAHYWPIDDKTGNEIVFSGYHYYIKPNRIFPPEWMDDLNDRIGYCRLPDIGGVPTINPEKVYLWQYSSSGNIDTVSNNTDVNMYIVPQEDWTDLRADSGGTTPPDDCEDCQTVLDCLLQAISNFISAITSCLSNSDKELP